LAIIGTWRDTLKIDQAAVREYVAGGLDIIEQVVRKCPTAALTWDAKKKELKIKADECVRCMHCINEMPKALHIGSERGATLLIGGKAPVVKGAMIGWVLVPFIKLKPPYTELKNLIDKIIDWWADNGKTRERVGELIDRVGLSKFLKAVGLKPLPQMVRAPRANPYIFWSEKEVTKNE
jgi:sulfite reductase alpha subunit